MAKHLRTEYWFDKTSTGSWRRKRVGKEAAAHFPEELRKIYQARGPGGLTKHICDTRNLSLAAAWAEVKRLFNGKPGRIVS